MHTYKITIGQSVKTVEAAAYHLKDGFFNFTAKPGESHEKVLSVPADRVTMIERES